MLLRDLQVGETYTVDVPELLPEQRFSLDALGFTVWWQWQRLRGCGFEFTVTQLPAQPAGEPDPLVTGVRVAGDAYVDVRLSGAQVDELGLPSHHGYRVAGTLVDDQGRPVTLPKTRRMTVALSWMSPLSEARPARFRPLDELA